MPAKAMTYKFLNTFIDDLFAFTIKMPMLHRLATLRDDVIFFVYLYQSWKYKVDYTRVNEFGQGGGDDEVVVAAVKVDGEEFEVGKGDVGKVLIEEIMEGGGEGGRDEGVKKASGSSQKGSAKKRK